MSVSSSSRKVVLWVQGPWAGSCATTIVGTGADVLLHGMGMDLVNQCVNEGAVMGVGGGLLAAATSTSVPTFADAAQDAEFMVTCLPNSRIVAAAKQEIGGALPGGSVWMEATSGEVQK